MKVKSESEVAQSCPTLGDPMDFSLPGSFVHGIFQARVLEWGAISKANLLILTGRFVEINSTDFKIKSSVNIFPFPDNTGKT